jgi:type IX secretion system substrate protein
LDGVGLLNVSLIPDQDPLSMPILFPEPLKLTSLPLVYEDSWTLLDTISTMYHDSTTGFDFLIEITFGGTFEIDAWGELNYPSGSVDCLRLYAFAGGALNVYPIILGFPLPSIYTQEYPAAHNYIWFAPDIGEVATVTSKLNEENPDFSLASAVRVYTTNDVSTPEPEVFVANEIELNPAWPNPFNASTTIQFAIPERQKTRVEIFDILGNSVAVLSDRVYEAGDHSMSWNASSETSGVYFIRMSTKNASRVQKIMLVK